MISRTFTLLSILIVGLAGFACQPSFDEADRSLNYIPAGADAVAVIRIPDLLEKSDWSDLQQSPPYQRIIEAIAEDDSRAAAVLRDPAAAGIDTEANLHLIGDLPFTGQQNGYMAVAMAIADRATLEEHMDSFDIQFQPVNGSGGQWQEGQVSMAWNDEVLFILNAQKPGKLQAADLLATEAKASMAGNKNLRKYLQEDFDLGIWMTSNALAQQFPDTLLNMLPGWSREDLAENFIHGAWRFETGKMVGELTPDFQARLAGDLDLLLRKQTEIDLSEGFPTDKLAAFATVSLDLPGMNQLLLEKMIEGGARQQLQEYGLDYDELLATLSGDMALGIYEGETPNDQGVVSGSFKDRAGFVALLDQATVIEKAADDLYLIQRTPQPDSIQVDSLESVEIKAMCLRVLDDRFLLSDDREWLEAFSLGSSEDAPLFDQFRSLRPKHSFVAVFDPSQLLGEEERGQDWLKMAHLSGGTDGIQLVLEMTDQSANSLESFLRLLSEKAGEEQEL